MNIKSKHFFSRYLYTTKIKFVLMLFVILSLIFLSACSFDSDESIEFPDAPGNIESVNLRSDYIESTMFRTSMKLLSTNNIHQRQLSQRVGNTIYFVYSRNLGFDKSNLSGFDENIRRVINLSSITVDGNNFTEITLKTTYEDFEVLAFSVSGDDTLSLLVSKIDVNNATVTRSFLLIIFDLNGNELSRIKLEGFLDNIQGSHDIIQAILLNDESIVANIHGEESNHLEFYNISDKSTYTLNLESLHRNKSSMALLDNNHLLVLDTVSSLDDNTSTVLHKISLTDYEILHSYKISVNSEVGIFSADNDDFSFDLLISDNDYLYGLSLSSSEQNKILNWSEIGITRFDQFSSVIGAYSDNLIYVLHDGLLLGFDEMLFYTLTPVSREDFADRTVLTLGGLSVREDTRDAVSAFNSINSYYIIEVLTYLELVGGNGIHWWENDDITIRAAEERMRIDLATGRGPDILVDAGRSPALLDLYPFIHSDHELDAEDFIPNVLASLENNNGELVSIYPQFSISTLVSTYEIAGDIEYWTPDEMLDLAKRNSHVEFPFGDKQTNRWFVINQAWHFLDWDNFTANFDSEEFIALLDTSLFFPTDFPDNIVLGYYEFEKLLSGEQLIVDVTFMNTENFQFLSQALSNNLVILGEPTKEGGSSHFRFMSSFSINAGSSHPEGAWEFIRLILLGDIYRSDFDDFSIKIDDFEKSIEMATTPHFVYNLDGSIETDSDGKKIENAHFIEFISRIEVLGGAEVAPGVPLDEGTIEEFPVYSMSENSAQQLRNLINSSTGPPRRLPDELAAIIDSSLAQFFNGTSSAEHTARTLQNRAEIFMSEQELLS